MAGARQALATRTRRLVIESRRAVSRGKKLKGWFDRTHAGRMLSRYGDENGNVLAGGIAYYSLVSIAAGLVLGATVVSLLAQYVPGIREGFFSVLEESLPGVVGDGNSGLVDPNTTLATSVTGIVGVIALIFGANRATRFVGGLRAAVVTMLGNDAGNPFQGKLRDFIALAAIFVIVVTGLVVQVIASSAAQWIVGYIPADFVSEWVLRVPAVAVGLVIDMLFVAMALMVLGHARGPWRRLWPVLLAVAVVIGALRLASSALVGSQTDNPVLGSLTAVITLLVFVDFTTRAILMGAAWLGSRHQVDVREAPREPHLREGIHVRKAGLTTRRATVLS